MKHGDFIRFQGRKVPCKEIERYPTENITTPIVLIHGDSDSLFELEPFLEHLPTVTRFELKDYEHIDVIWGKNVHIDVVPKVLASLHDILRRS
jgi:lysosomal acid lipase/cholesteryl ester hydrolase